jgi:hypothetical protein
VLGFNLLETSMDKDLMALEEAKLLQTIIARQDEFRARTKQWAVTLVGAILAASFTGQFHGNVWSLWPITIILSSLFMFIEAIFGSTESLAEDRVQKVEEALQRGAEASGYDGPRICDSMRGTYTRRRLFAAIRHPRVWGFYVALAGIGGIPGLFSLLG